MCQAASEQPARTRPCLLQGPSWAPAVIMGGKEEVAWGQALLSFINPFSSILSLFPLRTWCRNGDGLRLLAAGKAWKQWVCNSWDLGCASSLGS